MREILLTRGKIALVDDEDFDYLNQWKWHCDHKGYIVRNIWKDGKSYTILMHRVIAKVPDDMQTDHINHNKQDNRRSNLRICTQSQNSANRIMIHNQSGMRGIRHRNNKWDARINYQGKSIYLGSFASSKEASENYKNKAKKLFGEFSNA